jgi:tetratricopeptide (TPR) repeat protein
MKPITALVVGLLACLAASTAPVLAHDHAQATGPISVGLGTIHFPTSGAPRAQPEFVRGVLLLHSFEYDAARSAFQAAEQIDPGFAMAYWGEALTYNHTLWREQDLDAARAALAKLGATPGEREAKAGTARERSYLAAVDQLYGNGDKQQRDANYSAALGALARAYPDDLDARALYALSILGLTNGTRNVANYMRAAAEAEAVYQIDKNHPGALHYLIHAYDDPIHAPLGLRAARLYGKVVTGSSHAQHMPSHIFFSLGMWDEAIEANVKSLRIARDQHDPGYHSLLWLIYAYLQEGRRLEAEQLVRSIARDVEADPTKENRSRLAYARAIWLVETGGAGGADGGSTLDSSGVASIAYFAAYDFSRGITAGTNTTEAHTALSQLRRRIEAARGEVKRVAPAWYDTVTTEELEQATIMAMALDGAIRFYEGDRAAGIARVRDAVSADHHVEFEYGPPWSAKPLDELLGELLLADGQRNEAAAEFQKTLDVYPNRRLAREGLASCHLAAPEPGHAPRTTRRDLFGAWRLMSIQTEGRNGPELDPFFNADSTGILVYDPSGWMSVQIAGQPRPRMVAEPSRPTNRVDTAEAAQTKAAVLDTYYSYYGTWEYDEATSTVTHHIKSSLIPGETGLSYSQTVTLEGDDLIFTTHQEVAGRATVQKKIWRRSSVEVP